MEGTGSGRRGPRDLPRAVSRNWLPGLDDLSKPRDAAAGPLMLMFECQIHTPIVLYPH
jgi:hypothetical protein